MKFRIKVVSIPLKSLCLGCAWDLKTAGTLLFARNVAIMELAKIIISETSIRDGFSLSIFE